MEQFIDFKYLLAVARRRAFYLLIPFLLGSVAAVAIVFALPAMYESRATILVESQTIPQDLVRSTVTALATERLQVIQQRILTRDNVLRLVDKFGLFPDRSDLSKTEMADLVRSRITIAPIDLDLTGRQRRDDRLTIAFTVAFEDENPVTATGVANELVTNILNEDLKTRSDSASETTDFLGQEVRRLTEELANADAALSTFKQKNSGALPESLQFNISLLDRLEKSITDTERDIASIDEQKRLLTFEESVRIASTKSELGVNGKADLESKVNALRTEISAKSAVYSETHPEMRALRSSLKALEAQLDQLNKSISATTTDSIPIDDSTASLDARVFAQKIQVLDTRKAVLQSQLEDMKQKADVIREIISKTPEVTATADDLARKRAGIQKSLDDINEKFAQAKLGQRLEQDQRAERFEVIEQPIQPQEPSKPPRLKLMGLGLGIAAALGGGIAVMAEFLDNRVRSAGEFEARFGRRPMEVIPYIRTQAEMQRRRRKNLLIGMITLISVLALLAAIHFLYQPLDVLYYRIHDLIRERMLTWRWGI